jgi:non-specific serine/threonine protein kinase
MHRRSFRFDEARARRASQFAAELAEILHILRLTHKEVARRLGVTHHTIDSWTRGVDPTIPGGPNLDKLCALLEAHGPGLGRRIAKIAGHKWEPEAAGEPPPPSPTLLDAGAPSNLPHPLNSFVGRAQQIAEVQRHLAATRLLTLTGAGGIGKTRLALQVAGGLRGAFADGVWLVELAALADPRLLPQLVATTLGLGEQPARPAAALPAQYLRHKHLLLILDNCEHLIDACAALVTTLLQACPRLTILATSREMLRVAGELVWRVPPMSLPDSPDLLPPEHLAEYEAVQLFVDRARACRPGFALTEQNAPVVAQICRRLDGIPLALELAAANTGFLAVEQLAARLDERFHLLTGGSRAVLPRHRTLRATIDWSYDLLSVPERLLFRRLPVFPGGCILEGAEAVCAGEAVDPRQVLGLLKQLVDKSLVHVEEVGREARYEMLETVRQYAAEKLEESAEEHDLRRRHAEYYLTLAEQAEPELRGPQQVQWLDRLETEHDNLRAALTWCLNQSRAVDALRLGGALWRFWEVHGHVREGSGWLEAALAIEEGAPVPVAVRAKALNAAGNLALDRGDLRRAQEFHEGSLALRRELNSLRGIASSLTNLGNVMAHQGDYPRAVAYYEESLALRRQLGDRWGIALVLDNLGVVAVNQGDDGRAIPFYEESLALRRELEDQAGIARSLKHLGLALLDQGNYPRAERAFAESLELEQALGDQSSIAESLNYLGRVAMRCGDPAGAQALYAQSLRICKSLEEDASIANGLTRLAEVALAHGDAPRAVRLLAAATAAQETGGVPGITADRAGADATLALARTRFDPTAFTTAWAAGHAMSLEEAIDMALDHVLAGANLPPAELPPPRHPGHPVVA